MAWIQIRAAIRMLYQLDDRLYLFWLRIPMSRISGFPCKACRCRVSACELENTV